MRIARGMYLVSSLYSDSAWASRGEFLVLPGRRRHPSGLLLQSQSLLDSRPDLCRALDTTAARIDYRLFYVSLSPVLG